ncbi:protein kinase superfamily protein isoform X2 [Wolffia australiana]
MRVFVVLLFSLLQLDFLSRGASFPSLPSCLMFTPRRVLRWYPHLVLAPKHAHAPAYPPQMATAPSPGPAHYPRHRGSRHHRSHLHAHPPSSFSPPKGQDCGDIICVEPLTMTPFGSPCGCVLPMQVEIDLGVAPFRVLSVVGELEVQVAAGIYMKQSQVRIMGAAASNIDPEKTRVDIDLVPLGEKFDNLTAFLTYERFWQGKVPINASMFGDYQVIFVRYPGLPSSPPPSGAMGPSRSSPIQNPFTAYVPLNRNSKMNARTVSIIALSSFLLVLIFAVIFFVFLKWKRVNGSGGSSASVDHAFVPPLSRRSGVKSMNISSSLVSTTSMSLVSTMATCPPSVKTFSLAELEKATDGFSFKRVLGEGGFGRVYHGTMDGGAEAAIKLLTRADQNGDREFIAEVEMLSRLHHRNLVKLVGICIEGRTRCLVYELVPNGSVESHLHGVDRERGPLGWDARLKVALGAARGLAYLHEDSNPRVIHRDFKASNVLLEEDFTPKVSDFGLAKEASEGSQHISTRVMGTFGYVAPEYAMTGHLLVKSDVYSYGVVLLELLSGRKPVDYAQPRGEENLVTWARPLLASREGVERLVDPSLDRAEFDFADAAKVAAIASMCVHPEVTQRPFMGEVVQALKLIHRDESEAEASHGEEGSSAPETDFREGGGGGGVATDGGGSWWNGGDSFVTMDYYPSSGPMEEEMERPKSDSNLVGGARDEFPAAAVQRNRSGPLRTKRHRSSALYRLRGSMSEHELLSRRFADGGLWF